MPGSVSNANQPKKDPLLSANNLKQLSRPALYMIAVVVADQVTKLMALAWLDEHTSVEILGRFVMFTLLFNYGGAMGTNFGSSTYYLVSSLFILAAIIGYIYLHRNQLKLVIPLSLIAGGAIGNIIDRVRLGKVIDFVDVDFFDIDMFGFYLERWWTFNVADAVITCSMIFLLVHTFFFHTEEEPAQSSPTVTAPSQSLE